MKSKNFKQYGDWLFEENNSLIYEKEFINEDIVGTLTDAFQSVVSFIGILDPTGFTDATNAAIYLARGLEETDDERARGHYMNALFCFISILPGLGDAVGKSAMLIRYLNGAARNAGRGAQLASWVIRTVPNWWSTIRPALVSLNTFLKTNKSRIIEGFEYIRNKFIELQETRDAARSANSSGSTAINENSLYEAEGSFEEDQEYQRLPQQIRNIVKFVMENAQRFAQYFTESRFKDRIIKGLRDALEESENVFSELIEFIDEVDQQRRNSTSTGAANPTINSPGSTAINEHVITDTRLKKLAGIIR